LTCDYRGFGRSTGSPTEGGILTDGITLVNYALDDLHIPSQNIMLFGQSLGTAITTGVALWFADPQSAATSATSESPLFPSSLSVPPRKESVRFAAVGLSAPFVNIPELMHSYRIFGVMPVLSPLRPYPKVQKMISSYILDRWETDRRINALVKTLSEQTNGEKTMLQIIHARDDYDITFRQSQKLFEIAAEAAGEADTGEQATKAVNNGARGMIATVEKGKIEVELTIAKFGGKCHANFTL
jgi:abhydrolase domain-containing protein 12